MKTAYLRYFIVSIIFCILIPGFLWASEKTIQAIDIAKQVALNVGEVDNASAQMSGKPIIIIDETHNSRAGQIQEAIIIERLYKVHGLLDISLEGYLFTEPKLTSKWYVYASKGNKRASVSVAVQLLKTGEINAAEFLKLIHENISIHPIEKREDYQQDINNQKGDIVRIYLLKIAFDSVNDTIKKNPSLAQEIFASQKKLKNLIEEFQEIEKGSNTKLIDRKRNEVTIAYSEYQELILATDSWAKNKYDEHKRLWAATNSPSLRGALKISKEIYKRANDLGIKISPDEKVTMKNRISLLSERDKASITMANSVINNAKKTGNKPLAMIIGKGHTAEIVDELKKSTFSYASITPLAIKGQKGGYNSDIPWEMFLQKYKKKSLYTDGFFDRLLQNFEDTALKKPRVVLNEPWLQAKAESFLFTYRIVNDIFNASENSRNLIPPNWDGTTFKGKWVSVDPRKIVIQDEDNESLVVTDETLILLKKDGLSNETIEPLIKFKDKYFDNEEILLKNVREVLDPKTFNIVKAPLLLHVEKIQNSSVIFPLKLINSKKNEKTLWVKAANTEHFLDHSENINVEELLKNALREIKSNKEIKKSSEDKIGRIQISEKIFAAFGDSKEKVQNVSMISSI